MSFDVRRIEAEIDDSVHAQICRAIQRDFEDWADVYHDTFGKARQEALRQAGRYIAEWRDEGCGFDFGDIVDGHVDGATDVGNARVQRRVA